MKILRRSIEIFFFTKTLVEVLHFKLITLDCNNGDHEYAKNRGLGLHSSPLYFTLLRSLNLPKQYPRWTSNICKYVEQMVSTDIPNSENQSDWFKGVDMEVTVRNHIRQMLQNIKSQYISKNCSTNCSKKNNLSYRTQTSVPKICWPKRRSESAATKHYENTVKKGIQRTPPHLMYIRDSIDQGATRLGGL